MAQVEFLGFNYLNLSLNEAIGSVLEKRRSELSIVVTPNSQHISLLKEMPNIDFHYKQSAYIFNDSKVVGLLASISGKKIGLLRGSDLVQALISRLNQEISSILVVGPSKIDMETLKNKFTNIDIECIHPVYGLAADDDAIDVVVDQCASSKCDLIFICLGFPLQEKIAFRILETRSRPAVIFCVGAAIDFLIGKQRRAPRWMQHVGLEWFFRLASEPGRLWKRYLIQSTKIFYIWILYTIKTRISY